MKFSENYRKKLNAYFNNLTFKLVNSFIRIIKTHTQNFFLFFCIIALACGKKLPPEPAGNPTQSDSKAESTRRSGESTGTKRVLGSQPAEEGEWPWTVRLLHSRSPDLYCGGAILNKRFILTNARCFGKKNFISKP